MDRGSPELYQPRGIFLEHIVSIEVLSEILSPSHIVVNVIIGEAIIKFEFKSLKRQGIRNLETDLYVTYNTNPIPYNQWLNVKAVADREALLRQLAATFHENAPWAPIISAVFAKLVEDYNKITAGVVKDLIPDTKDTPIPFLISPYIVEDSGTIFFGPPGKGKSWTAMLMAVSIDSNSTLVYNVKKSVPVLYVNLERSEASMSRRLAKVNTALGLDRNRRLKAINLRGYTLTDTIDAIKAGVLAYDLGLVIVDSMSRSGATDLNSNVDSNQIMNLLNSLQKSWMIIAHTPRDNDNHIYGSIMQEAAADVVVGIRSKPIDIGKMYVTLRVEKANEFEAPEAEAWEYTMNTYGLVSVVKTEEKLSLNAVDHGATIQQYLVEHGESTTVEIAEATKIHRSTISTELNNSEVFYETGNKRGRAKLYNCR